MDEVLEAARIAPKGEPETYGATPLNQSRTLTQQLELTLALQEMVYRDVPEDVPEAVFDYVHTTFARRFRGRADANEENYFSALRSKEYFSPEEIADRDTKRLLMIDNAVGKETQGALRSVFGFVRRALGRRVKEVQSRPARSAGHGEEYGRSLFKQSEYMHHAEALTHMIDRAELGIASAAELLLVRDAMGIRSVELACLTHPYGSRIDPLLEEMREVTRQNVELLGGTYYEKPETRYRAKELILDPETGEESLEQGILMTRKRTVGYLPDGTIIRERSSFVLRTDVLASHDPAALARMQAVDCTKDGWQDELIKAGNIESWVEGLLKNDEFSTAIPISTTIYAYNEATAQEVRVTDVIQHTRKTIQMSEEFPHIAAAFRGYDLEHERPLDVVTTSEEWARQEGDFHGMYYSGPRENTDPATIFDEA